MGGNIFKTTARLSTEIHKELGKYMTELIQGIRMSSDPIGTAIPLSFPDKPDHGDLDILVGLPLESNTFTKLVIASSHTPVILHNSSTNDHTLSLDVEYKGGRYQVDLEFMGRTDRRTMEFSRYWHSYGGLGNIFGTLFRRQGLKLRPTGLYFDLTREHCLGKPDRTAVASFKLLDDWQGAMSLLELQDPCLTYQDQQALFKNLCSSPLCGKSLYVREGRDRKSWDRDKRRPIYTALLDYMEHTDVRENPVKELDTSSLLREAGLEHDILLKAADTLLQNELYTRVTIPPPIPKEYATYADIKRKVNTAFTPLDKLVMHPQAIERKVRQLSADRVIYQ
jgi:hypothetical protein